MTKKNRDRIEYIIINSLFVLLFYEAVRFEIDAAGFIVSVWSWVFFTATVFMYAVPVAREIHRKSMLCSEPPFGSLVDHIYDAGFIAALVVYGWFWTLIAYSGCVFLNNLFRYGIKEPAGGVNG